MKHDSPFERIGGTGRTVPVRVQGREIELPAGETLAAALLGAGVLQFRHTAVRGTPRGPFCMMGACFDCRVEIDGVPRQACMAEVTEGLDITLPGPGGQDDGEP